MQTEQYLQFEQQTHRGKLIPKSAQENRCSGCTLCCTVLQIPELDKPAWELCVNCTSASCSIWKTKPNSCNHFICLWYANPKWPEGLRPDNCGVVFEPGGKRVLLAMVGKERPEAWKEGVGSALIKKYLDDGTTVIVQVGAAKHFVLAEGDTVPLVWERVVTNAQARGVI